MQTVCGKVNNVKGIADGDTKQNIFKGTKYNTSYCMGENLIYSLIIKRQSNACFTFYLKKIQSKLA